MKNTTLYSAFKVMMGVAEGIREDLTQPPAVQPQDPELYTQNHSVVFNPVILGHTDGLKALMWIRETTNNNRTSTYLCCSTDPDLLYDGAEKCTYLDHALYTAELLPVHSNDHTRQVLIDTFVDNIADEHASRRINSSRDLYHG